MIHQNSTESFQDHKETGKAEAWRRRVFESFIGSDRPRTDRAVMMSLGTSDPNLVRPEISRLIDDEILREVGKTRCIHTNKTVRVCEWTGKPYFSRGNKKAPFFAQKLVESQAQMSFSAN